MPVYCVLLGVTASCGPVASPVAPCETFACVLEVSMMTCMTILKVKGHVGVIYVGLYVWAGC